VAKKVRGRPFKKGQANPGSRALRAKSGAGRKKGTPNKWSRDIREAVLNALERLGGDDYLVMLGRRERKAFSNLIGKAMPMRVEGAGGKPLVPPGGIKVDVNFVDPKMKAKK
jgi:hypothetical protein